ncbi:MAG: M28 family peptidase, partial [Vicinamibacterales bacterium]
MRFVVTALPIVVALSAPSAQEAEDRTLLTWDQMRAIINEASGDRAMHHVLELVPYPRVRNRSEYEGHFRESEVMARFAREYGFSGVEIESFPATNRTWHATRAELWMIEPVARKLFDIQDVAIAAASGSESGDVTADLVDAGPGRAADFDGRDVKGKIVLGAAPLNALARLAAERGAAGVLSYNSLRADERPDQILSQGLGGGGPQAQAAPRGFGWAISPRVGRDLTSRVARGEKVRLRSIVEAETFPGELEVVHAAIPGDGSSTQAIAVSAHLYEGYQKQGANDDNSGCAMTLEAGRTLIRLIKEGALPKPKRAIHFLWVPEISGTNAWLRKHEDVRARLIADLNFDMEGIALRESNASWVLHRTPDTFPSFLNDLSASFLEAVADLNRERVRYRHHGYAFTLPVVSPNGTRDQFNVKVEKHYGASDHAVFLQRGIPAVIFNTWPDPYYHSSEDTPDKLDPTQFKRAAVVTAAAAIALAAADDAMAARVMAESLAPGAERMGGAERKALAYL